jgi:hypothetical protein
MYLHTWIIVACNPHFRYIILVSYMHIIIKEIFLLAWRRGLVVSSVPAELWVGGSNIRVRIPSGYKFLGKT